MPHRRSSRVDVASVRGIHVGFNANFDAVYDQLKSLHAEQVSVTTMIILIKRCIVLVEDVTKTTGDNGAAKKQLVLALMSRLIDDAPLSDQDKVALHIILEELGPDIIETALEGSVVAKNRIKEFCRRMGCM